MGKTTYLFKKIRDTKRTCHTKMGIIKYRNSVDLKEVKYIKRGGKNAQNYSKKDLNDPWCDNSLGARQLRL